MGEKKALIRDLNDSFRSTFVGGRVLMTAGVHGLPEEVRAQVLTEVHEFRDFTEDNDPHGEHDFGAFDVSGHTFFWKIDYYDNTECFGSEDPSDPEKTTRVLTVMLAEDY